ncbi:hypothetical protein BO71DRAFT_147234 [Aspergillus ellipticus CBS 707.79]|uniref:Uncharacterized protein n=1 Tax=Aspergillus ellipticus CBS 707.79 TaxID=1448320 RepID=A0A319CUE4_9EURO|nr:hypothetical protein BO71DRAFT_147234 [Aspergillus ellipticus CBS 707.79]
MQSAPHTKHWPASCAPDRVSWWPRVGPDGAESRKPVVETGRGRTLMKQVVGELGGAHNVYLKYGVPGIALAIGPCCRSPSRSSRRADSNSSMHGIWQLKFKAKQNTKDTNASYSWATVLWVGGRKRMNQRLYILISARNLRARLCRVENLTPPSATRCG